MPTLQKPAALAGPLISPSSATISVAAHEKAVSELNKLHAREIEKVRATAAESIAHTVAALEKENTRVTLENAKFWGENASLKRDLTAANNALAAMKAWDVRRSLTSTVTTTLPPAPPEGTSDAKLWAMRSDIAASHGEQTAAAWMKAYSGKSYLK